MFSDDVYFTKASYKPKASYSVCLISSSLPLALIALPIIDQICEPYPAQTAVVVCSSFSFPFHFPLCPSHLWSVLPNSIP